MPSSLLAVECREAVSRSSHSWAPDYALGGTAAAAWALSAEALDELARRVVQRRVELHHDHAQRVAPQQVGVAQLSRVGSEPTSAGARPLESLRGATRAFTGLAGWV